MFLPNYSGDGQGKSRVIAAAVNGPTSEGKKLDDTLPVWSGDGRRNIVNPLMPVFHSDGARPAQMSFHSPTGRTLPPQALPVSGDGQGKVTLSNELTMQVNAAPAVAAAKNEPRKQRAARSKSEQRAERSETWKLVTLVVIFLIWISTASTLLFLYMDRYLFP
ncbi:MAG: hypothetical protein O3C45_05960 [Bacteroidetes bacterium]|nr:hypothetical protein [Bacteroidota bacterium]MDA0874593.1 hypothetical protein [Bacteroidota bacterium]